MRRAGLYRDLSPDQNAEVQKSGRGGRYVCRWTPRWAPQRVCLWHGKYVASRVLKLIMAQWPSLLQRQRTECFWSWAGAPRWVVQLSLHQWSRCRHPAHLHLVPRVPGFWHQRKWTRRHSRRQAPDYCEQSPAATEPHGRWQAMEPAAKFRVRREGSIPHVLRLSRTSPSNLLILSIPSSKCHACHGQRVHGHSRGARPTDQWQNIIREGHAQVRYSMCGPGPPSSYQNGAHLQTRAVGDVFQVELAIVCVGCVHGSG